MDDDGPADSDASASMHEIPRAKKPELPKPPFEQFTHQSIVDAAKCGVNSDTDLSPARMERAWDDLGKQGQQYWEARYGRQVVEFHKENEIWERNHPQLRFTYDPEEGHNFDYKALNFDVAPVAKAFDEFVGKCIDHLFNLSKGPEPTSAESEMPSTRSLSPPPHPLPKVLYRAELYRLRVTWLAGRTRKLRATYLKTFEHDKQMPLTLHSSKEQSDAPIFEVTTFLAAPKMPKKGPLEKIFHPSYSDNDSFSDGPHPEPIRYRPGEQIVASADAGMILTINSESIIEALHSVAPGYPDLAFEGDSLVVAEPYCVLLQFRDEMLEYRDSLLPNSSSVGIELHNNQVADKDIDDFVAKGLGVSDMQVQQNSQQPDHITELYKFLDQRYLNAMNLEKQRWECHEAVCTFEWAWLLFTPGTLVYEEKENTSLPSAFTVESFSLQGLFHYDRHSKRPNVMPSRLDTGRKLKLRHRLRKVTIVLTYLKNDGRKWIPAKKKVKILPFNGERLITNLPIYPAKYRCDPDGSVRQSMVARGRRYQTLSSRGQFEYHGFTISGTRRWLDSRIIVDSETFHHDPRLVRRTRHSPDYLPVVPKPRRRRRMRRSSSSDTSGSFYYERRIVSRSRSRDDDDDDDVSDTGQDWDTKVANILGRKNPRSFVEDTPLRKQPLFQLLHHSDVETEEISDEIYLICEQVVNAYVLEERDWVLLDVDHISDCIFDEDMINDLQVGEETKHIIQALSHTYSLRHSNPPENNFAGSKTTITTTPWSSDFVPNKGRGQLLLLHGKPGVGKTTAAECVAEQTKRPLLSITCGDLGTTSSDVEEELTRWLRLGALWNAVLLFDEADIFLEARERGDIKRNSLVSVFLRALEYYQGLMFLTTNRVGTFDEAVISRVHVVLHFPELTDEDRARIWDSSFRKLGRERGDVSVDFSVHDFAYRGEALKGLMWNGREIRNAFNTMIALAEWDAREKKRRTRDGKIEIRREHLQQVATMSSGFKEYLMSLRSMGEADHAKLQGLRDDLFAADAEKVRNSSKS